MRLDERLAYSPVRDGWIERSHFHDAVAAMWVEGELVHLEDLVFRDAEMDQRVATHELTRAHSFVRKRRRILSQARDWALGREGLRELTGRGGIAAAHAQSDREGEGGAALAGSANPWDDPEADHLAEEFAEIDAVLARSSRLLAGDPVPPKAAPQSDERLAVLYDLDWDEGARFAEWRQVLDRTSELPTVLRAALALDAWADIEVLQRGTCIGGMLVAAFFRQEGIAANHLACLHLGAQKVPRERRRSRARTERVIAPSRCDPRGSHRRAKGARQASACQGAHGGRTAWPPRQLEAAGTDEPSALAAVSVHQHGPNDVESVATGRS